MPDRSLPRSISVFCGSSPGTVPAITDAAHAFGTLIAERGYTLVYGGGGRGVMATVADAALAAGGRVIGVIPRDMVVREWAHEGLTELVIVDSMHERKAAMAARADAFVALPGGIGTLDEFFEVWTWRQLGLHHKPCGILNTNGYFDHLLAFVDGMVAAEFLAPFHRGDLIVEADAVTLLNRLVSAE